MEDESKAEAAEVRGHLDRGWSWVVLAATFVAFFIMQGQLLTGNIYFIIYLREFLEPRSITAFTAAAYTATVNLTGPLSSILLRKFGPRVLMMTGGLIMSSGFLCIAPSRHIGQVIFASGVIRGVGASFIMNGCQAALTKYFSKRLYVATGIMYSASAMGMMTVGLMTEYAIGIYGWRGSLAIQAGLTIQICLCGALVFKIPVKSQKSASVNGDVATSNGLPVKEANMEPAVKNRRWPWRTRSSSKNPEDLQKAGTEDGATSKNLLRETEKADDGVTAVDATTLPRQKSRSDVAGARGKPSPRVFMRDSRFWCISGCTTMLYMFTTVIIVFWKDILPHKDHFKVAVVSMAIGNTLGRATAGFVSNRIAPPLHQFIVSTLNAVVIMGFLISEELWVVGVHNFAWGFLNGQQTVADRLQLAWVYGRLDMAIVLGFSLIFAGFGGFTAPPLAGFITDSTGSYFWTLLMTSAFSASGGAFSLALYFLHKKRLKEDQQEKDVGMELKVLNNIEVK